MEDEILDIFSTHMEHLGTASRGEVHKEGFWHQTFHCWFVEKETESILLQRRNKNKKDYPNLLDITVAGHLSAGETPLDGVREIKEEVGIEVQIDDLIAGGIYQGSIIMKDLIDNEFCHLFFYNNMYPLNHFSLQKNEVESIVRIPLHSLTAILNNDIHELEAKEFHIVNGVCSAHTVKVCKGDFVPHESAYFQYVITTAKELLNLQF